MPLPVRQRDRRNKFEGSVSVTNRGLDVASVPNAALSTEATSVRHSVLIWPALALSLGFDWSGYHFFRQSSKTLMERSKLHISRLYI